MPALFFEIEPTAIVNLEDDLLKYADVGLLAIVLARSAGVALRDDTIDGTRTIEELRYAIAQHEHPLASELVEALTSGGVRDLEALEESHVLGGNILSRYEPSNLVQTKSLHDGYAFGAFDAYAVYNWEVFFHVPFMIATHLSKNQRFEEAQKWFHHLFDPTDRGEIENTPEGVARFWRFKPFQQTDVKLIEELVVSLAIPDEDLNAEQRILKQSVEASVEALRENPFRPHAVARHRPQAYMYKTVMAYLDNLVEWGDTLFRQDTRETVNEALQLYIYARQILGPRPQSIPKKGKIGARTYAELRKAVREGSVLEELETEFPFMLDLKNEPTLDKDERSSVLRGIGRNALYFCVPKNPQFLRYWDIVEDRLFKIRNSLSLDGIFRQPPLLSPPIDPGVLARATAAGIDVGSVLAGLNQPLPRIRFRYLLGQATELCQEVRALGGAMLSAIEKRDGECMVRLRSEHERKILKLGEAIQYGHVEEAKKQYEGSSQSLLNAVARYAYYERQLGRDASEIEVSLESLDSAGIDSGSLSSREPLVPARPVPIDIAAGGLAKALSGGQKLSSHEVGEAVLLEIGQGISDSAALNGAFGALLGSLPNISVDLKPLGIGAGTSFGGSNLASVVQAGVNVAQLVVGRLNFEARRAARTGGFSRREQEWAHQSNNAAGEINQIMKQVRAAEIRTAVAERELASHREQILNEEETANFLADKQSSEALYVWMKKETKGLFSKFYDLAYDISKRAERALQHELGDSELTFVQPTHLAGNEGLLAGERLLLDLKRMDTAYSDLNRREYELTARVSLSQIDPAALLALRTKGICEFDVGEDVFDFDAPGHYFRRLRSVAVTIPAVTGPNVSVNCTASLLRSSVRKDSTAANYPRSTAEDLRFSDYFGPVQSIVTSRAVNDAGLFDGGARDERYLPFEGYGAIGRWQLQLPADPSDTDQPRQFDYGTISDVILELRYTAREGGRPMRAAALKSLDARLKDTVGTVGSTRLISVRREFPTEWAQYMNSGSPATLSLPIRVHHLPYWSGDDATQVECVSLEALASSPVEVERQALIATDGIYRAPVVSKPDFTGKHDLEVSEKVDDLWLLLKWRKK